MCTFKKVSDASEMMYLISQKLQQMFIKRRQSQRMIDNVKLKREKVIFDFRGESKLLFLPGLASFLIAVYFAFFLISSITLLGVILGTFLLSILYFYLLRKFIIRVYFYSNFIIVKRIFKSELISVDEINFVYKNQEGFVPIYVYVFQCSNKKATISCSDLKFEKHVKPWLLVNKIKFHTW